MSEEERLKLGEDRKLIFRNFCNGVPVEQLTGTFLRSADEIEREVLFVARKLREFRFRRTSEGTAEQRTKWNAGPPVQSDTLLDIRLNRRALMETLSKVGPKYLSSALLLPNVQIQKVDHPSMLKEAKQRLQNAR